MAVDTCSVGSRLLTHELARHKLTRQKWSHPVRRHSSTL